MRLYSLLTLISLMLMLLLGCGQNGVEEAVTPTATIATVAQVTDTPSIPSPTPAATATIPPPPTIALPTGEPTATATATPAAILLLTAADFGSDRNPFTGELVEDISLLQRRPLASKISNAPPRYTRPQSGLGQADIVFEHITEAAVTRFTAIIYSQTPERVGPLRSGRLIDVELPAMYDTALVYSGSSIGVSRKLFSSDFRERILRSNVRGYYRTGEDKPYEHTLYARPEQLWQVLDEMGLNRAPEMPATMAFSSEPPPGGQPATGITIDYSREALVAWEYDEVNGRYWRWADGEPHSDANTGEQISAANVVVVYAPHQLDVSICELQQEDRCLLFSIEIQIWGEGPATIFRDGQQYGGRWERSGRSHLLTFYDEAGEVIPLQIGNTWFQVVSRDSSGPVSVNRP
jgi:hypothetical protein